MCELEKMSRKCDMCKEYHMNKPFYLWVGILSGDELIICTKCAKREGIIKKKGRG